MKSLLAYLIRALLVIIVLSPTVIYAQWGLPDPDDFVPDPEDIQIDLENLIADIIVSSVGVDDGPRLTTTLDDAITDIPFLDNFNPGNFQSMRRLDRRTDGSLIYRAGRWRMDVRSYCLNAAMYGPGTGDGYLYAPLRGPCAGQLQNILRNSALHPEIPQRDVQCLLWGILSSTNISDMSSDLQRAARALLSDDDINFLNGSALGLVPNEHWDQVFGSLNVSPSVRRVLEAHAGIRTQLSGGSYTYNQIESIAMLSGEAPREDELRNVPEGRWSCHPGGYFIRYFPHGYSRMTKEVSVPYTMTVQIDDLGRVTSISDVTGRSLELEYDDSIAPLSISGTSLSGYAFKSIRYDDQEWTDTGWAIAGFSSPDDIPETSGSGRFSDAGTMTGWASGQLDEVHYLCGDTIGWPALLRLGLLTNGIQSAVGSPDEPVVEFCMEAWQDALLWVMEIQSQSEDLIAAKSGETSGSGSKAGGGGGGGGGGGAAPGRGGSQIIGDSDNPSDDDDGDDVDEDDDDDGDEEDDDGDFPPDGENDWRDGYDDGYFQGSETAVNGLPENLPVAPIGKSRAYYDGLLLGYQHGYRDFSG